METKALGALGEKIACGYLVDKGYDILGKNDRISFGEIDIIAQKRHKLFANPFRRDVTIHFVEVKTIMGSYDGFYPEDRVDFRKQRKLRSLCQIWLKRNRFKQDHPHQIDVIGIVVDPKTRNARLRYTPNAVGGIA